MHFCMIVILDATHTIIKTNMYNSDIAYISISILEINGQYPLTNHWRECDSHVAQSAALFGRALNVLKNNRFA
jgi:hypothetical protein